jgi:PIN domain nuclease of toxin-antitoxin system
MRLLLDTQLLLWAAGAPRCLSSTARKLINAPTNDLLFSVASVWEIAMKLGWDFQTTWWKVSPPEA